MKTTLLIISFFFTVSITYCQDITILDNDVLIKKHFNKKDIKTLNKILNFFDQIVKQNCESNKSIEDCYVNYCEQIKIKADSGSLEPGFSYEKEKQLFNELNIGTINKIWYYTKSYRLVKGKKVYDFPETIELIYKSPFMNLCRDISDENPKLKFYYENFQAGGSMNSVLIENVIVNYDKFNFSNPKERLMIAIHYLTINTHKYKIR